MCRIRMKNADFRVCLCRPILVSRFGETLDGVVASSGTKSTSPGGKSKRGALLRPHAGNPLQQSLDGQRSLLSPLHNDLEDVGCKIAKAQKPPDMGVVKSEASRDFHRTGIRSAAEAAHPCLSSSDCENECMVDVS